MSDNEYLAQMDDEIIGHHLIDVYTYRLENPTSSVKEACEVLDLPYQSVLAWIRDGRFTAYLNTIHDPRSDLAQSIALNNLPSIVKRMADVAIGKIYERGTSQQAAADFILKVATGGARGSESTTRTATQVNVYMPTVEKSTGHSGKLIDM